MNTKYYTTVYQLVNSLIFVLCHFGTLVLLENAYLTIINV